MSLGAVSIRVNDRLNDATNMTSFQRVVAYAHSEIVLFCRRLLPHRLMQCGASMQYDQELSCNTLYVRSLLVSLIQ